MSKNRYINTQFWADEYIENLESMQKYLFLYCLTNPLANIAGIYKISLKRISYETNIDFESLLKLFEGFERDGKVIFQNGWLACKNTIKHQKLNKNIETGINEIINNSPRSIVDWVCGEYLKEENERLYIDFESLSKASNYININININSNINSNINEKKNDIPKKVKKENKSYNEDFEKTINYLNQKNNKNYKISDVNKNIIIPRLKEGFSFEDCKKVINNKTKDWINNPEMEKYLRPATLFCKSKFEGYLNENNKNSSMADEYNERENLSEEEAEAERWDNLVTPGDNTDYFSQILNEDKKEDLF
jgi:uncharacterized phage protein (TIGR02220 family)